MIENSRNSRSTMPPMNRIETKTATIDRFIDSSVKPTSLAPASAAANGVFPDSTWRVDVFQHHDGVVHDEAGRDDQRHQRQVVRARSPSRYITPTAADQRHRAPPPPGSSPRAAVAEEQQHDEDHETDGDEQRLLCLVQRRADGRGAVAGDVEVDTPAGSNARSAGSCAVTPSTVAMMLARGCRLTTRSTAGLSLKYPAL